MRDRNYYGLIKSKGKLNLDERLARKYRWYSYFRSSDGVLHTKRLYEAIKALKAVTQNIDEYELNANEYYDSLSYAFDNYEVVYALLDICADAFGVDVTFDAWIRNKNFVDVIFHYADRVLELKEKDQMNFTNLGELLIIFIEAAAKALEIAVDYDYSVINTVRGGELYSKARKNRRKYYSSFFDDVKKWVKTAIALLPTAFGGLAKADSPKASYVSTLLDSLANKEVRKHNNDMDVLLELLKSRTVSYNILKERAKVSRQRLDTLLSKYIVRLQNYYKFSNPENAPGTITRDTTYKQHIRLLRHLDTLAAGTHLQEMIASMPFYEAARIQYLKMKDSADFKKSMAAYDELMLTFETDKPDEGYGEYIDMLNEYARSRRISIVTRGSFIVMRVKDETGSKLYDIVIRPVEAGKAYKIPFRPASNKPLSTVYDSHVLYYDLKQKSKYVIWNPEAGYDEGMGEGHVGIFVERPSGSIADAIVILFDVSISLSPGQ